MVLAWGPGSCIRKESGSNANEAIESRVLVRFPAAGARDVAGAARVASVDCHDFVVVVGLAVWRSGTGGAWTGGSDGGAEATTVLLAGCLDEAHVVAVVLLHRWAGAVWLWPLARGVGMLGVDKPQSGRRLREFPDGGRYRPLRSRQSTALAGALNGSQRLELGARDTRRFAWETVGTSHLLELGTCAREALGLRDHVERPLMRVAVELVGEA